VVRAKAGRPTNAEREAEKNDANGIIIHPRGSHNRGYIRARLERDGKTELLAKIGGRLTG
jgi:hypothetical protein